MLISKPETPAGSQGMRLPISRRLAVAGYLALAVTFIVRFSFWGILGQAELMRDNSGIFMHMGQRLAQGAVLYRDVWDHKPPLIFWFNALGSLLSNEKAWGIWLVCTAAGAAWLWWLRAALRRLTSEYVVLAALAIALFAYIRLGDVPNFIESFTVPFQALILYLYVRQQESPNARWLLMGIGGVGAILFNIRANNAGVLIAIAVVTAWANRNSLRDAMKEEVRLMAGFLAGCTVLAAPLAAQGMLSEYWFAAITTNIVYSAAPVWQKAVTIYTGVGYLMATSLLPLSAAGGCAFLAMSRKMSRAARGAGRLALVWMPIEMLCSATGGVSYKQYYLLWLVPAVTLAVVGLGCFGSGDDNESASGAKPYRAAFLGFFALVCGFLFLEGAHQLKRARPYAVDEAILRVIRAEMGPEDLYQSWGAVPRDLWFRLNRLSASRLFHTTPMHTAKLYNALADEILQAIETKRPRVIVEWEGGLEPPLFAVPPPGDPRLARFAGWDTPERAAWKARLAGRYEAVHRGNAWAIYRLRGQ